MYRLLTCLTVEHDPRLVAVAVLICAATAVTAFKTYEYALSCTGQRRTSWLLISGFCAASGIWGTHFVAMLAYRPGLPIAFNLTLTAFSLLFAILSTSAGFAIAAQKAQNSRLLGGAVIGAGIALMHFTGMAALEVQGHVRWEVALASFAALFGIAIAALSLRQFHLEAGPKGFAKASALLVLAIAGMHFTAMAAAEIAVDPTAALSMSTIDRALMGVGVTFTTALALIAGILSVTVGRMRDRIKEQTTTLRAEVEDRKTAANWLALQQTILGDIMRDDTFRHGNLSEAIGVIDRNATRYRTVDVSYVYHVEGNGSTLSPFHFYDRRQNSEFNIATIPTTYFAPSGNINDMKDPAFFSDLQSDPRITASRLEYTRKRDLRAAIDMPIVMDGNVIGVYCIRACGAVHEWTEDEKLFATSLSNLAALAFERHARQQAADDLRVANANALAATKAKSQFLANMSHEIRTPMNGVFGMTDLLSRTDLNDRQRRLVDNIGQSARTLLTIINDILDLSRIEEGKFVLDKHDFALATCIEDTAALLIEEAQKKGLELSLYIEESVHGTAQGDSVRLRQVLLNLIGNAIKFTSKGEVSIHVTPSTVRNGIKHFRFEVHDTGIGIDPANLEMLFKPFTQADSSISRRFGGTGLGLSISRHLVTLMGGDLSISSEPSKGTLVSFEIPLEVAEHAETRVKITDNALAGLRILVVDDRAANREIICSYLAGCGVQAEPAESAEQALVMLQTAAKANQPFAQAIVDLIMPGIDGLELCRRISTSPDLKSTQLILLSSLTWSQDLSVARAAGVERMLHKPIRRNELISIVSDLLLRHEDTPVAGGKTAAAARSAGLQLNLKVLVAEDNPVNQVIASEYLANLGCSCQIAENGLQTVASFERERFDCILMDCQMPEMDGLKATRAIREREAETGAQRMPIIAVTANAFEEDRQRCLESGMDSYISKPFSEETLAAALMKAVPSASGNRKPIAQIAATASVCASRDCSVLDLSLKHSRPALFEKLVSVFLEHAPKLSALLSSAMRTKDLNAIMLAAHSLKSSSANVGATVLSDLCRQLEFAARNQQAADCMTLLPEVVSGLNKLCERLKHEKATTAAPIVA